MAVMLFKLHPAEEIPAAALARRFFFNAFFGQVVIYQQHFQDSAQGYGQDNSGNPAQLPADHDHRDHR